MLNSMKKYMIIALAGAIAWTGCQVAVEDFVPEQPEETLEQEVLEVRDTIPTWTLTVLAERGNGPATKGLEVDGEEATTTLLQSVWKADEPVKVYLGTDCIGTLTATPDVGDAHLATLSGTVTTASITPNTTTLTLLTPRESWDYTGQIGKLLLSDEEGADPQQMKSIERLYHYTMAADILVTDATDDGANNWTITTEDAHFTNQQSIYRLSFRYNDGVNKTPITTKSVTISAANGHLVQSQVLGGATTEGPISVTLGTASADPFFVALRNCDETNAEALTFTVVDNTGVTYRGSKNIPAEYKPNGTFVSVKNASLNQRLDLALSATEVNTVL